VLTGALGATGGLPLGHDLGDLADDLLAEDAEVSLGRVWSAENDADVRAGFRTRRRPSSVLRIAWL
jgi:hypothetical protein